MEQTIERLNFSGGMTTVGEKVGETNSARFIKNLNIFEDPSYVTLSRAATKVSETTVDSLVHWICDGSPWNTNRYFYALNGKIFQETSASSWSSLRTVSGGGGEGLLVFDNGLFYAQGTELGKYFPLDNSPAFQDSFSGWWIASQLQDTGGGTGATDYVPPTSIAETAAALQTFTVSKDPIKSITINVDVVGTGNWTITLHSLANKTIASKTIANGDMIVGDNTFTFASVARVRTGESYHIHVTSTVADGGVDTNVATDLEGAYYLIQYGTLIDADFHPIIEHLNGFVIGNEHYLGFFDNATFEPNKIELAPGFQVRSLSKINEMVIADCWRGQSFEEAEEARRYYWDGIATTFNYFDSLPIIPNAVKNYKGRLITVMGNRGSLYSNVEEEGEIIDEVPKLARGKKVEVYPGAIDIFEEKLVIGYAASTDDATGLEQGIYEYGTQIEQIARSFNFPYTISTGTTQGLNLKIGCVKSFGKDLYIGWRDGTSYGVDKITAGDSATASGEFEDRIFDGGNTKKEKQAIRLEITFEALTANQSVTPKYKLDRAASFTSGTAAGVGETSVEVFINTLFREAEWGFTLASSNGTFPKITGQNFVYDDLSEEKETTK